MKDSSNGFVVLIVGFVAAIAIVSMLFFSSVNRSSSDFVGFASYPGYASPVSSIVVDNNLAFGGVTDSLSRSFIVSDSIVYRFGYVSYDGQSWTSFNLSPSGSVSGDWMYTSAQASVLFTPTKLRLNSTRNSTNNTYVLVYSCSKNTTLKSWDCHDGWQILQFNAKFGSASSGSSNPVIAFVSPTPNTGSTITSSSQEIAATVSDDSNAISSWIDFDNSLIGYWSMDYYSSIGIYDNSTYKNFAFFNGGLSTNNIVTGIRGKALSFDGVNDGLNMGDVLDLGVSDYSYSMWIKANDNRRSFILTKGAVAGYNGVRIETDTTFHGSAILGYSSDYYVIRGPAIALNNGQWHHIVVTFDRDGYGTWYTDGVAGTPIDISAGNNQNIDVADNLYVGSTDHSFNGSIDELMIFNRVLSPSEVKALYDSKINRFDATLNGLTNGQHSYIIYAVDGSGNTASSSQRNFNVNGVITPPNCSVTSYTPALNTFCGSKSVTDNCNVTSVMTGTLNCISPTTCDGGGIANVCGSSTAPPPSSTCTYYVSPSGSDNNFGTISSPWFTLNKAWLAVSAGGTICMRGGTYRYGQSGTVLSGKSGTSSNYITIENYPGEKPIINYSDQTFTSQLDGLFLSGVSYIHIKGIRITGISQPTSGTIAMYGLLMDNSGASNCIFEQLEFDHIGGWGIVVGENSNNNLFLNCDSHHNADPYTGNAGTSNPNYGWSDGIESASITSDNNVIDGCRFWSNSDDGLDLRRANGHWTIKNTWSFWNGYIPGTSTTGGDGEGFKLGGDRVFTTNIIRTVTNCLAFENRLVGFSPEPDVEPDNDLGVVVYNSVSYKNALGINFEYNNVATLRNNIIYANTVGAMYNWGGNVIHDHNVGVISDLSYTVTNADFVSVSSAGADGPRNADGSLPNLAFLHLTPGSKLIDAGVNVGLPYNGNAPDLGAFEYGGTQSSCTPSCSGKQCGSDGCSGTCGTCSNSHGTMSCSSSGLCQPTCSSGYANCDSNTVNGCETQLGTTSNCASCGNSCSSGQTCNGGICTTTSTLPPTDSTALGVCLSNGYNCGTATISGSGRNCGSCSDGLSCTNNLCVSPTSGQTLYVATNGNDNNPGTFSQPYATINKAWSTINAGGIIYVRGGTYTYAMMGSTSLSGKSGTAGNMINIWNYPGEKPIIDFSANTFTSQVIGIYLQNINYIHIKGIRVTSINQPHDSTIAQYGMILWDHVSNCIFEQMETDHIGGWGTVIGDASNNNLFLNCDSHHNSDRYTTNGDAWGWSDGFQSMSYTQTYQGQASTGNIFRGCRSYWNSDDGWDLRRAAGLWTIDHCWSFMNGRKPGEKLGDPDVDVKGGDGEAYKLGQSFQDGTTDIKRILVNSLSYDNGCGVEAVSGEKSGLLSGGAIGMQIYNNVFYHDQVGVNIQKDADGNIGNIYFYNNIIHGYTTFAAYEFQEIPHHGNNIFTANGFYHQGTPDLSSTVSNSDFLSLDSSCLDNQRKADGSLPDCDFLKPSSNSQFIGAGVNVGLSTDGAGKSWKSTPSIGSYEYYP